MVGASFEVRGWDWGWGLDQSDSQRVGYGDCWGSRGVVVGVEASGSGSGLGFGIG